MAKKKIDILDFLPEKAMVAIDNLGYEFLQSQGYDTEGAKESKDKRNEIKKQLQRDKKELTYRGAVDKESGAILVWYELKTEKEVIRSTGIKFMPIKPSKEGGDKDEQ